MSTNEKESRLVSWTSDDGNINGWKEHKIIPEDTAIVTVNAPTLKDSNGKTPRIYVVRYVNGYKNKSICSTDNIKTSIQDDLSEFGQGTKIKYNFTTHDGTQWSSVERWSWTYTKNTFIPGSVYIENQVFYNTSSFFGSISGCQNTDGSTNFKYSLFLDDIKIYNSENLTDENFEVSIYREGTLPTTPYIKFQDLKNIMETIGYVGSINFKVKMENAYGTVAYKTTTLRVDLRIPPKAASNIVVSNGVVIQDKEYFVPYYKDIRVSWNAGADLLGGSVRYEVWGKQEGGKYSLLAENLAGNITTCLIKLPKVDKETKYEFKVRTICNNDYNSDSEVSVITLHRWSAPKISITDTIRSANEFTAKITTYVDTTIPGAAISSRKYIGFTQQETLFAGSPYSLKETGLSESSAYRIKVEVSDNTGFEAATVVQYIDVNPNVPIVSIRKNGLGVNDFADENFKFKVNGKSKLKELRVEGEIYAGSSFDKRVYHEGYKPTAENIGAIPASQAAVMSEENSIVRRNQNGDVNAIFLRSEVGNTSSISGAMAFRVNSYPDNGIRFCSDKAKIRNFLGLGAWASTDTSTGVAQLKGSTPYIDFRDTNGVYKGFVGKGYTDNNITLGSADGCAILKSKYSTSTGVMADTGGWFRPMSNNDWACGHASYRWSTVYYTNLNAASDGRLKENIQYLDQAGISTCDVGNSKARSNAITTLDHYNFVKNDLRLATYDYKARDMSNENEIKRCKNKTGFIAQDVLNSKVGKALINEDIVENVDENISTLSLDAGETVLSYDLTDYVNVLAGALQVATNKIEQLENEIIKLQKNKK